MTVDSVALAEMSVDEVLVAVDAVEDISYLDELEAAEKDGQGRVGVLDGINARRAKLADAEVEADELPEDVTYSQAPVAEVVPVIRVGDWARISGSANKVPTHARGRDVAVTAAAIRRGGNDTIGAGYEYQLPADVFQVRLRDTGEVFACTRAAFAAFGPDRGALDGLLV